MHTIQALSLLQLAHGSLTYHCQVGQEILTSYSLPQLAGGQREGWSLPGNCALEAACHRKRLGRVTDESAERGSSARTVVPVSCPPSVWGKADRHRAGVRRLVIRLCGEVSSAFVLAGSNLRPS